MKRLVSFGALFLLALPPAIAASAPSAQELLVQVRAEEAMGELIATQSQQADAQLAALPPQKPHATPAAAPGPRLSYDLAIKAAAEFVATQPPADSDHAQFNAFELQHELAAFRSDNLHSYLELNRKLDQLAAVQRATPPATAPSPTTAPSPSSSSPDTPQSVKNQLQQIASAKAPHKWKRPANSLLAPQASPPPEPGEGWGTQPLSFADQPPTATEEGPAIDATTPQGVAKAVADILSGKPLPGAFAVPSAIAPTNGRMPGSLPWNPPLTWTFSMPAATPWTQMLHADPPGTPAGLRPSPEVVARLASTLAISADQATDLAMGRTTMADIAQQQSGADTFTSGTTLAPNDARWGRYYFGPGQARNGWSGGGSDFTFSAGGGTYIRSDTRVNQANDARTNGASDRRVNSSNDRRANVQVDPRGNR